MNGDFGLAPRLSDIFLYAGKSSSNSEILSSFPSNLSESFSTDPDVLWKTLWKLFKSKGTAPDNPP